MNYMWLFAVAIGPVILALAFIYIRMRRHRLTRAERAASKAAVDRHYGEDTAGRTDTARPRE